MGTGKRKTNKSVQQRSDREVNREAMGKAISSHHASSNRHNWTEIGIRRSWREISLKVNWKWKKNHRLERGKKKMEKLITNFVHRHKQLVLFPLRASASAPTPNPNRFSSSFLSLPPFHLRIVMPKSSHRQIADTVQLAAVRVPPTHLYSRLSTMILWNVSLEKWIQVLVLNYRGNRKRWTSSAFQNIQINKIFPSEAVNEIFIKLHLYSVTQLEAIVKINTNRKTIKF